jgi:hypothetical protein
MARAPGQEAMNWFMTKAGVFAALAWAATTLAATPQQRCQGSKNLAAGKYAACRQEAEKGLALNGDTAKYDKAIAKCEKNFGKAWQKAIDKAAKASTTCLDAPLVEGDFKAAVDAHADIVATALGGGGLVDCPVDLATCTGDLDTCTGSLGTCTTDYATCTASLDACTTDYTTCSSSLATCSAGTAVGADVLAGKTFSSSAGIGATGTMPSNGGLSIIPGTATQTIPAGYHDGTGSVAGDPDLTAANVRIGVGLFGVTGTLGCGNGAIDAGEACDQGNLDGATCASQGFAFGILRCGADCVLDASGCYAVRFTDNGDGTVTDADTGLLWEKKGHLDGTPVACTSAGACPDPHDADNQYTYSAGDPLGPPGTAYTVLLAQLNAGSGFAGHTDWRLPTLAELQSLADYTDPIAPVTSVAFDAGCSPSCTAIACSCSAAAPYWTNDLVPSISGNAWLVEFGDGSVLNDTRDTGYAVRAVR